MKAFFNPTLVALAALMLALPSWADGPAVTSTLAAKRVETTAGKVTLSPAESAKPGDTVEYTGTWHNAGIGGVEKLVATLPVPKGTTFVAGSAEPARAQASTDGAHYAAMPLMRSVRLPDGTTRQEPVPLADYRFLRWEIGTLAPHAETAVKLRVQIDSTGNVVAAKP